MNEICWNRICGINSLEREDATDNTAADWKCLERLQTADEDAVLGSHAAERNVIKIHMCRNTTKEELGGISSRKGDKGGRGEEIYLI